MQNPRVIPATRRPIEIAHASGAEITIIPPSKADLIRLSPVTKFDPNDEASFGPFALYAVKVSVVAIQGSPFDGFKRARHRELDVELAPDDVAEFVLEDPAATSAIIQAIMAALLGGSAVPNSSRQPAGSTDAPSGLPPKTSSPTE